MELIEPVGVFGESMKGNHYGYAVEARYNYPESCVIDGITIGRDWKRIDIDLGNLIISKKHSGNISALIQLVGLYTQAQAESVRWMFTTRAEVERHKYYLETRIVMYNIVYNISSEATRYIKPLDHNGNVPKDMIVPKELPEN